MTEEQAKEKSLDIFTAEVVRRIGVDMARPILRSIEKAGDKIPLEVNIQAAICTGLSQGIVLGQSGALRVDENSPLGRASAPLIDGIKEAREAFESNGDGQFTDSASGPDIRQSAD